MADLTGTIEVKPLALHIGRDLGRRSHGPRRDRGPGRSFLDAGVPCCRPREIDHLCARRHDTSGSGSSWTWPLEPAARRSAVWSWRSGGGSRPGKPCRDARSRGPRHPPQSGRWPDRVHAPSGGSHLRVLWTGSFGRLMAGTTSPVWSG